MFVNSNLDKAYASIGANCLSEVQLIKRFTKWKGLDPDNKFAGYNYIQGPFDTALTTPNALLEILQLIKEDRVIEYLGNIKHYYIEIQPSGEIFYGNRNIQGFTLTHEDDNIKDFEEIIKTRFKNFIDLPANTNLIWSNAQANFTNNFNVTGSKIQDYYLNKDQYEEISKVVDDMFGFNIKFAVRSAYTEKSLLNLSNVYAVDIPFSTEKLFGSKKHFDEIFEEE